MCAGTGALGHCGVMPTTAPTATTVPAAPGDVPLGLYVHVPFCIRRCGYCAFVTTAPGDGVSETDWDRTHQVWAEAAMAELATADRLLGADRPALTSVYFGGGTPTAIDPALVARILDAVRARFDVCHDLEVTIEANPDGLRSGQFERLVEAGVTRCSLGLQSAVPRVLDLLDRTHPPELAAAAVEAARRAGVHHVGLDLIYGTPGERPEDWAASIDLALGCGIDHLSVYALAIEPGTKLAARVRRGDLRAPDPDEAADRYLTVDRACRDAGLHRYELSNWAREESARCRHNLLTWRDHHWWGIGPGAHSHVGDHRWWNHSDLGVWSRAAVAGDLPAEGGEVLDDDQRRTERLMLGLRLDDGIPSTDEGGPTVDPEAVRSLVEDGLIEADGTRVRLSDRGRLLADHVIRRLL